MEKSLADSVQLLVVDTELREYVYVFCARVPRPDGRLTAHAAGLVPGPLRAFPAPASTMETARSCATSTARRRSSASCLRSAPSTFSWSRPTWTWTARGRPLAVARMCAISGPCLSRVATHPPVPSRNPITGRRPVRAPPRQQPRCQQRPARWREHRPRRTRSLLRTARRSATSCGGQRSAPLSRCVLFAFERCACALTSGARAPATQSALEDLRQRLQAAQDRHAAAEKAWTLVKQDLTDRLARADQLPRSSSGTGTGLGRGPASERGSMSKRERDAVLSQRSLFSPPHPPCPRTATSSYARSDSRTGDRRRGCQGRATRVAHAQRRPRRDHDRGRPGAGNAAAHRPPDDRAAPAAAVLRKPHGAAAHRYALPYPCLASPCPTPVLQSPYPPPVLHRLALPCSRLTVLVCKTQAQSRARTLPSATRRSGSSPPSSRNARRGCSRRSAAAPTTRAFTGHSLKEGAPVPDYEAGETILVKGVQLLTGLLHHPKGNRSSI